MDLKFSVDSYKFKARANGIIVFNDKVLMCSINKKDFWCCPGGHIHFGEDSKSAVLREIKEEVEIDFEDAKLVAIIENFYLGREFKNFHEYSFYYLMKGEIPFEKQQDYSFVENDEGKMVSLDFKWISLDEVDDYNIMPNNLKTILKNRDFDFHHIVVSDI